MQLFQTLKRINIACAVRTTHATLMGVSLLWLGINIAYAGPGMEALTHFFAESRGFSAEFEQSVFDEKMRGMQSSKGSMALQRPGLFRWEYRQPYEQLIIGDGQKIWIYDADLEQVTVKPQNRTLGDTPAQLLSSAEPLDKTFHINELGKQRDMEWVELIPLATDANFGTIRLGFRDQLLQQMEFQDNLGNSTLLEFSKVVRNPDLAPGTFTFTPPQGVDVVGQ